MDKERERPSGMNSTGVLLARHIGRVSINTPTASDVRYLSLIDETMFAAVRVKLNYYKA